MPPEVLDYVVVHELAHRKEMNHSRKFWAEVKNVLPDYEKRRKWLKEFGGYCRYPDFRLQDNKRGLNASFDRYRSEGFNPLMCLWFIWIWQWHFPDQQEK